MANENKQQVVKVEIENQSTKPETKRERKFMVEQTVQIPRGASHYTLPQGKTISSMGYDIAALESAGVKLKEVTKPVA